MSIKSDDGYDDDFSDRQCDFLWTERSKSKSDIDDSSLDGDHYNSLLNRFQDTNMGNSKKDKESKHKMKKRQLNDESDQDEPEEDSKMDTSNQYETDVPFDTESITKIKKEKKKHKKSHKKTSNDSDDNSYEHSNKQKKVNSCTTYDSDLNRKVKVESSNEYYSKHAQGNNQSVKNTDSNFEDVDEKLNYLVKREKVLDMDSSNEKKVKKSKKTKSQCNEFDLSQNMNSENNKNKDSTKKKKSSIKSNHIITNDFEEEERYLNSKVKIEHLENDISIKDVTKNKKKQHLINDSDHEETNGMIVEDILELGETVVQTPTKDKQRNTNKQLEDNGSAKVNKKKSLGERIVYEEDIRMNSHSEQAPSLKLKQYMENNNMVKISTNITEDFTISEDDNVWLVRCPHDINHQLIKYIDLLDGTCKMKVEGKRYEGTLEAHGQQIALLKKGRVQGVLVQGILKMNRRTPRVHLSSTSEDRSSDLVHPIPLPSTTVRHPLLGFNFESSLKLPEDVVERLKVNPQKQEKPRKRKHSCQDTSQEVTVKKKKKKHDRHKNEEHETNIEWDSAQQIEQSLFG